MEQEVAALFVTFLILNAFLWGWPKHKIKIKSTCMFSVTSNSRPKVRPIIDAGRQHAALTQTRRVHQSCTCKHTDR